MELTDLLISGRKLTMFRKGDVFKYFYLYYSDFDGANGDVWREYITIPITRVPHEYSQYRIVIDDTNVSVYNVERTLKAQSPIASNFWSLIRSDGFDIRVFDHLFNQLWFWVGEFDYTNKKAEIWVRLPENSEELNIAYGNPSATKSDYENPEQVFELFDDFEDGVLGSQWEYHDGCSTDDYYEESNGVGTIHVNYVDGCSSHLPQANYNDTPTLEANLPDGDFELIVVVYNWNPPAGDLPYHEVGVMFVQDEDDFLGYYLGHSDWKIVYSRSRFKVDAGTTSITTTWSGSPDTRTYRYIKVVRRGDTYTFYYSTDGITWSNEGSETKAGLTKLALSVYVGSGSYSASFDFVQMKKLADPADFGTPRILEF